MTTIVLACAAALLLGLLGLFVLGDVLSRRRNTAHGHAALASLDQIETTIKNLEASLALQREETERARAQRDEEARKAREYFEKIDGVVTEANECRRLLVKTGAEHGNAQAMMLAEIDSLAHQYAMLVHQYREATGKAPPRPAPRMNAAIQVVAAEFRDAHVAPYQQAPVTPPVDDCPHPGG